MIIHQSFKIIIAFVLILFGQNSFAVEKSNRIEELFIWKISEELSLSVKDEHDFDQLIRDLNQKKLKANDNLESLLREMNFAKPEKRKVILVQYREALKKYNDISIEELEKIQKLLGEEKSIRYFVSKTELLQKIRTLLISSDQMQGSDRPTKKQSLPEPKLIEE